MRLLLTFSFLLALLSSQAVFAASVWQVTKDNQQFYVVGTVHLLSETDFPLPTAFDTAFNASSHLIFETDLAALTSPAGMNKMMAQNTYPPGQSLQQVLSSTVYQQLKAEVTKRQWPLTSIEQFKPAFAAMMLATLELQRLGAASAGVDMHYLQLALQQQKSHSGLETVDAHLAVLSKMNNLDADLIIKTALEDLEKTEKLLGEMKAAWRIGDTNALAQLFVEDLTDFPALYDILLADRNHAWINTLAQRDLNGVMVLVGALHMVGEDGLLDLLSKRGYKLTQIME